MTSTAHNLIVLREAQRTIDNFEKTYGLSTADMLKAAVDDERLAQIDGFELMDWHFAIDQKDAISRIISASRDLNEEECSSFSSRYSHVSTAMLANTERQLDLVA